MSSASGTDPLYEHSTGERALPQTSGLLNTSDGGSGVEGGTSLSPGLGSTSSPGTVGVSSAPATPEANRQDRGFLIHSSPLSTIGTLSGSF